MISGDKEFMPLLKVFVIVWSERSNVGKCEMRWRYSGSSAAAFFAFFALRLGCLLFASFVTWRSPDLVKEKLVKDRILD